MPGQTRSDIRCPRGYRRLPGWPHYKYLTLSRRGSSQTGSRPVGGCRLGLVARAPGSSGVLVPGPLPSEAKGGGEGGEGRVGRGPWEMGE